MAVALKSVLLVVIILMIKKPCFTNSSSCCYWEASKDSNSFEGTYIYPSLWQYKQERCLVVTRASLLRILLLLAGDVELCPGPMKPQCQACWKTIRRNQISGTCAECKNAFHLKCLKDELRNNKEKFYCNICFVNIADQDAGSPQTVDSNVLCTFMKKRGLKLFHQNVNGIMNKLDQIRLFLCKKDVHIFGISESHTSASINDSELEVDGYVVERKDRNSAVYGGVLCYIRDGISFQRRKDLEIDGVEAIWVEVFIVNSKSILICIVYKPPDSSLYLDKNFNSKFDNMLDIAINENKEVILAGDLNCDYLAPTDHRELKDVFKVNGLKQLITTATRITAHSKTLIDLFFTTHEQHIADSIVYANSLSDHDLTGIIRKINLQKFKSCKIRKRDFSKYDKMSFRRELSVIDWNGEFCGYDLNHDWNIFKEKLSRTIDNHVPFVEKSIRGRVCPWLTRELKSMMISRDYYLKQARQTNQELHWSTYRRLRNLVTSAIKHNKANFCRNLLYNNGESPKTFWKLIKKLYPGNNKTSKSSFFKVNNELVSDTRKIANGFCRYFSTIGSRLQQNVVTITNKTCSSLRNDDNLMHTINPTGKFFKFSKVNCSKVAKILQSMRISKAAGPDNLPASLLKDASEELALPLCILVNMSFEYGTFPNAEKCGKVIPIYKSEDRASFDNYRPISVLNTVSKVIERIAHQQITDYLERNQLLCPQQFGFRRGKCTQHAVTYLNEHIRQNMDKSRCTGVVYLDLRKAFDTVSHACLLNKLPYYGIRNIELLWMKDYLLNRSQFVYFNQVKSDEEHVSCGVPQGSILGPLLFVLQINDLYLSLKKCNIIMYADDTVLYYSANGTDEIQRSINSDIERVSQWLDSNKLIVNLKKGKTEFVLYGTPQKLARQQDCSIMMNGTSINQVKEYEYLGIIMDNHLTLSSQVSKVYKRVSSRLSQLSRIRSNISPYVAERIYRTMIYPIMFYCYPVYLGLSNTANSKIQRLQDRAARIIGPKNCLHDDCVTSRKRCVVMDVFKSLHSIGPNFPHVNFQRFNHGINTRSNNSRLIVPKVKTEAGRKSFSVQGVLLFNSLSEEIRNENSYINFKRKVESFNFSSP
ncbi:Hypothetical predicted protein [Paramuricea clavata]|uniref:Uncharacterized protein n=1 Tax=Paramuricea clavata TaxID=317549 RepID=A0A6S7IKT7_PARCT|nr:Hypothetical predicted protein [Paramuricea clavata]